VIFVLLFFQRGDHALAATPDAEVIPEGVSVRQAPAPNSPIIAELPGRSQVEVLFTQRGPGGNWAHIVLPSGQTGFVQDEALRRLTSPPQWKPVGGSPPPRVERQAGEGVLDIPLRRVGGVFLVTARINSQVTTNFIVDTGATSVMISEALADQLGLDYVSKPKQRTLTASGFLESPRIILDSIHVPDEGGARVARVEAQVATLPGAPPAIGGLLGQSFLRHFQVTIEADRAVMHLRPRKR
jgi:aspartyl protease family protein